jgi:hypothetical protein
VEILQSLLKLIDYSDHLKKTQTDWESRWANVEELINFATEIGIDAEELNSATNISTEHGTRSVEECPERANQLIIAGRHHCVCLYKLRRYHPKGTMTRIKALSLKA